MNAPGTITAPTCVVCSERAELTVTFAPDGVPLHVGACGNHATDAAQLVARALVFDRAAKTFGRRELERMRRSPPGSAHRVNGYRSA